MKVVAIIQARMTSERLPRKVVRTLCGEPMIVQIYRRVQQSKLIDDVIVATSITSSDDELIDVCNKAGIKTFRGNLNRR